MTRSTKSAAEVTALRRAYFASVSPEVRKGLEHFRKAIRAAAPDAVEIFSYGIPGFVHDGQPLLWYAAWKQHYALYPVGAELLRAHAPELRGLDVSKGTIRFPLAELPTAALVTRLAQAKLAQLGREKGRT